ncbi:MULTISPECIES: LysR substrate-binding domain-containing protein [Rhizobium]|uniref:Transcriptional regulator, LysR family n=1 Tax=Rhizobium leguminosarum bv. trifolii (strain WSM1325) TaxID=395491 RepID=C6AW09_RHILS|nr:LysR substrate-binding domain-containing protein [Rhizobium leguminosarum]ACS57831.1 transcriptional regulator, LysR family [Rhizobium leguminosarum bv. trifolii WSM1325]MBY2906726.1 LysR family transcriptional regulator [Rhizobium leguminosarum]MBY2934039.1 LysR family transcriptional regulator [Rhizobium leguminosarum]MBY2947223.1 LysR family transcriptional regulator [Rhizobium leguminosarum]MBY2965498.1 LysR family transcriptional regulator [Rhizobium leguminosarum]
MRRTIFDLEVLRTFSTGMELGNFAKAAERLGRSTSAVSAQLKKLEEQAGTPIFRKAGRGLALTDAGETMLGYARRLLELNDEAAAAVNSVELEGWVRLGLQEDFGETLLPDVLGRFARAHPKVRIEARVVRNAELLERVTSGKLDLALAWSDGTLTAHCERIGEVPMRWIGPAEGQPAWQAASGEPMPLASLEAPCLLRSAATKALDEAGISWRLAFVSPSLGGLWAATAAGLGLTIRTPVGLPAKVRPLAPGAIGLPDLPKLGLVLHRAEAEPQPAAARLAELVLQSVHGALRGVVA